MDRALVTGSRSAAAGMLALVAAAAVASAVFGGGAGDPALRAVSPLSATIAAGACLVAARRSSGRMRDGWVLMAVASVGWAFGRSGGDGALLAPRLLGTVSAAMAVVQWLRPALTAAACLRVVADGLVLGTGMLFLAWPSVEPLVAGQQAGAARLVALVAPLGDLAVLALVIAAGARVAVGVRHRWSLLAGGLVLFGLADGMFAYLRVDQLVHLRVVNELAWAAGALLVTLAALHHGDDMTPLAQQPRPSRRFHILVSYAPLVVAGAEVGARAVRGSLDATSVAFAVGLAGLLFLRQLLAQFETLGLNRELDRLVRVRTLELQRQERRFRSLVQHATDVVTVVDHDLVIRYQSQAAEHVFGVAAEGLVGSPLSSVVHPDDVERFTRRVTAAAPPPAPPERVEARMRRADGRWVVTETSAANLLDEPGVEGLLLTTRDISDRKRLEEQLRHDALHDPLTGLANRLLFRERLDHAAACSARSPHSVAVLMLDLDGFKSVNDTLGHGAGDRLLTEVASRLVAAVRTGDTVARMGGDEFAILVERADAAMAEVVADRILSLLRLPFEVEGRTIVPSGSLGVALGATDRMTAEELLQAADLAMYTAKTGGKGRYRLFEEGMAETAILRLELEADLRRAIAGGELVLHFQPIVELPSGRVSGAEALVR
ncbi:MAG TPA: diguanylate cyclase, partial [Acidimicrobiales bacterium]|nr:diguanylate cyclase [Acidimicrobiales bacterium]